MQDEANAPPHVLPGDRAATTSEALCEALLGGAARYTRVEAARLAGVPLERAARLWRALGYATPGDTERVFTDADVDALRTVTAVNDASGADADVERTLARALGQTMARLSEWQVAEHLGLVLAHGGEPTDAAPSARSDLDSAKTLISQIERLQQYVWRRHLLAASERVLTSSASEAQDVAQGVGFADIVGFTSLSRGFCEADLSRLLEAFETEAAAAVAEHGGQVIKTLGDEVMFTAADPAATAAVGLDLAERVGAAADRPELRVGLAYGPVLHRLGDVYGTVVNLAARLTTLARPGTVLVDRELADRVGDEPGFRVRRLRRVSVRGFPHLQPWLLRRG